MKYTLKSFLEDYEGFDFEHGEIVIVDQRCCKQYICKYQNGKLIHHYHEFKSEYDRELWSWTHTAQTMLIVLQCRMEGGGDESVGKENGMEDMTNEQFKTFIKMIIQIIEDSKDKTEAVKKKQKP